MATTRRTRAQPRAGMTARIVAIEARVRELAEELAAARDRASRLQAQLDMEHATKLGRAVVAIRRVVLRLLPVGSQRRALVARVAPGRADTDQRARNPPGRR